MIQGHDIICFCNDWDGDPLSKKHIITRLAKSNRILWVNSIGNRNPALSTRDLNRAWTKLRRFCRGCEQVQENIYVFSPIAIPLHGSRLARWINRRLLAAALRQVLRDLEFDSPILWTFVPSSEEVVGLLGEQLVIYHCVDEFSQFTGTNAAAIQDLERSLIGKADLVFVSAGRLYETKRRHNSNTFLIRHGVDVAHFRKACLEETAVAAECAALPRPVIGFFGLIADWVDLAIIRSLAIARPDWSFVMIGGAQCNIDALLDIKNIYVLGRRSYESLPTFCKAFDVAILPFVSNELTAAANPLKLREYLAAGLPVVATPLPEVLRLKGLVQTARTADEFLCRIEAILAQGDAGPSLAVSHRMDAESWDQKVEELSDAISPFLARERAAPAILQRVA